MSFTKRNKPLTPGGYLKARDTLWLLKAQRVRIDDKGDIHYLYHDVKGAPLLHGRKPFTRTRMLSWDGKIGKDGHDKPKMLSPTGSGVHVYIPISTDAVNMRKVARDSSVPIYITESENKAEALIGHGLAAIAFAGVDGSHKDGIPAPELDGFEWNGRQTILVPDSDSVWPHKEGVRRAVTRWMDEFIGRSAVVTVVLPEGPGKFGVDDFLATHGIKAFRNLERHDMDSELVKGIRHGVATGDLLIPAAVEITKEWINVTPPPLERLWGYRIPRGTLVMIAAEGGFGKSYFVLDLSVSAALGTKFLGSQMTEQRVLILSLEDPVPVIRERIFYSVKRILGRASTSITRKEALSKLQSNLVIHSLMGFPLHIVANRNNNIVRTPAFSQLRELVDKHAPQLIVVDPLSQLYSSEENANHLGTAIVGALNAIGQGNAARDAMPERTIIVPAHINKTAAKTGDESAHAIRGGSGVPDGARVVLRLIATPVEAKRMTNVLPEDRDSVCKLVHAKNNYGPKMRDMWLKRHPMGGFTKFTPEYKGETDTYQASLDALRTWYEAQGRKPFSQREVTNKKYKEAFGDTLSRDESRDWFIRALEAGDIKESSKVSGGSKLYVLK